MGDGRQMICFGWIFCGGGGRLLAYFVSLGPLVKEGILLKLFSLAKVGISKRRGRGEESVGPQLSELGSHCVRQV